MKKILYILTLMSIISCVPDGTGRKRGIFQSNDLASTCTESLFIFSTGDTCLSACPEGQIEANEEQKQELLNRTDVSEEIKEVINSSKGVCIVGEEPVVRPDGDITINPDFCICQNQKNASVNADPKCPSLCASQPASNVPKIIGDVQVGPTIQARNEFKNLNGFCTTSLPTDTNQPKCSLIISDSGGEVRREDLITTAGANSFSADLNGLAINSSFLFHIQETGSGSGSPKSNISQFRLTSTDDQTTSPIEGNLRIKLTGQYTCLTRTISTNNQTNENFYLDSARYHFYLPSGSPVDALPPGSHDSIFCHDYIKEGSVNDDPRFPRLEFIPGHFALWDVNDPRFIEDGNNRTVDFIIKEKMEKLGVTLSEAKSYFSVLNGCTAPGAVQAGNTSGCIQQILGLALRPFIDGTTGKSFCPDMDDYNGIQPEMKALGDVIGVPTEGLYYAEGPREVSTIDGTSTVLPSDVIMIRESILKKIAFQFGPNQLPIKVTTQTESNPTFFYWPPDYNEPMIEKKGFQKLYTVKTITELLNKNRTTEVPSSITPHDRKTACIPASDEVPELE